jgi:hypothetical protein
MLNRHNVRRRGHDNTLEDAGLSSRIHLHDLRHTAATLWLAAGESIYFVQQQLGHADIQTTIDQYGRPDKQATGSPLRGRLHGGKKRLRSSSRSVQSLVPRAVLVGNADGLPRLRKRLPRHLKEPGDPLGNQTSAAFAEPRSRRRRREAGDPQWNIRAWAPKTSFDFRGVPEQCADRVLEC